MIGGLGKIGGSVFMIIGQQKGTILKRQYRTLVNANLRDIVKHCA
jgi:acetyl-CoA carboxylase alpha subunit